ncbi:MAG: hypothetical protein RRC07_05190, partial [Anaerolineae bacterium]|nr:hypothetical protein [Anaerolineae bacterium]
MLRKDRGAQIDVAGGLEAEAVRRSSVGQRGLIGELRAALDGRVITPEDAGYEEARTIFYGGFERRPAAIVRVASAEDVARAVSFARE